MKTTELHVRPIRLWNPDRVWAHVFICMFADMVIWKPKQLFADFDWAGVSREIGQ